MLAIPEHLQQHLEAGRALAAEGGYRGRFAPSPTGVLHLGNLQTALLSWLAARQAGGAGCCGSMTSTRRATAAGAIEAIQKDLLWLGLQWDGPVLLQSERRGVVSLLVVVVAPLRNAVRLSLLRRELADQPIYPGFCRQAGHSWGWQQQRLPSWRLAGAG